MKHFRYDIHIHSALSPCADSLNSPNNILNMAYLTKLDIIAITDHNSLKQTFISSDLQMSYPFLYLYGVEIHSVEGYHILCYVKDIDKAQILDEMLDSQMKERRLENQRSIIFDEYDNELYQYPYNLHQTSQFSVKSLYETINQFEGIMILAHIERYHQSQIEWVEHNKNLFHAIEINASTNKDNIIQKYNWLETCIIVQNSDAHNLMEIGNHKLTICLNELSLDAFFQFFRG